MRFFLGDRFTDGALPAHRVTSPNSGFGRRPSEPAVPGSPSAPRVRRHCRRCLLGCCGVLIFQHCRLLTVHSLSWFLSAAQPALASRLLFGRLVVSGPRCSSERRPCGGALSCHGVFVFVSSLSDPHIVLLPLGVPFLYCCSCDSTTGVFDSFLAFMARCPRGSSPIEQH